MSSFEEPSVFMFPITNEQGFRVDSEANYAHMISTIINHTVELQEDYPDKVILVVYEVGDEVRD